MKFKTYMIVFSKDNKRFTNYDNINKLFNNSIKKFEAIDTINNFEYWKTYALEKKYTNLNYINNNVLVEGKGKLGCNLSHQILLEYINKNDDNEWFLVLEDDVGIKCEQFQELEYYIDDLINKINIYTKDSKFVQLCIYSQFYAPQCKTKLIFDSTYQKIKQFGTCAYLIHKNAIKYIVKNKTISVNMDFYYNFLHKEFLSLASFNNYFYCKGSTDSRDTNTELGSLIWEHK